MVWFGDDSASQNGMMMSLPMWHQYFKPVYKKLFAYCKSLNPDIKIAYHSCGNLEAAIEDFIEIGLDVLNPAHHIQSDTSTENVLAYYEEAKKPVRSNA